MRVSPEALQGLAQLLSRSAQTLGDLQTEPPLNIIGSELPGSDAARASTDVAIALTGAIRGISWRMTAMASIAQTNNLMFTATEDDFVTSIAGMDELL